MVTSIIALASVVAVWSLLAARFQRWRITAPILTVAAGAAVGLTTRNAIGETLNTQVALKAAEIILAILLFVDATEVRNGPLGSHPAAAVRILFVALPLSVLAAVGLGSWLLPGLSWPVLLVTACVVMPIDFAPAGSILRETRISSRARGILNVEAGYSDGIVSPIIVFALALAGGQTSANTPFDALNAAMPTAFKAVCVGAVVGVVLASLTNLAERTRAMNAQSERLILVAAPLLAYGVSVGVHGNGFVASFICGLAFHYLRRKDESSSALQLLDDISFLLTIVMWFVFGSVTVLALWGGIAWGLLAFCLIALTVMRMVPIALALIGSGVPWKERALIGWLGPRGTSSIVFGLLAFNVLGTSDADEVVTAMVVTVLGSVLIHSDGSRAATRSMATTIQTIFRRAFSRKAAR